MIKIFESDAINFSSNGLKVIKPISCKETKKKSLNGWEITLQTDVKYKKYIVKDNLVVIKSKSKANPQAFRLQDPKIINNTIEVTAQHIMFDANNYFLYDVRPTNKSALSSLEYVTERTDKKCSFIYDSDVSGTDTCYFETKTLFEAWQIIEERYNGVFDADNYHISFKANPGRDTGKMIVYNKNLQSFTAIEDWSDVITRIYPVGDNGLKLPERFIDADVSYPQPYTRRIDFNFNLNDDGNVSDDIPEEEKIEELRQKAIDYLNANKKPRVSYELSANIDEDYDVNDKIIVKHPLVSLETEVQEYTYDHIFKKTESIVFGNYTRDIK
ncbi:MAG: phage tail protein, partial [Bacilli bacterium]|nr:phage tail protein [Bacilli bacterium]